MAPTNRVKARLADGGVAFGTWLQTASPTVANILAHSGMDFVTIDMEHGPHSFSEAESILYAVEAGGSTPMIRLGEGSAPTILRALDIGVKISWWLTVSQVKRRTRSFARRGITLKACAGWHRSHGCTTGHQTA